MDLIDRLGYEIPKPNSLQRLVQAAAASRLGAAAMARILMPLDTLLGRLTGSRASFPRLLAGLPVVTLKTVGRRTGQERSVILVAIPFRDTLTLIGTNWGRPRTPGWVHNLRAEPSARIEHKGVSVSVVARAVEGAEHAAVMAVAAGHYPGYLQYQHRITNRPIRIFSLQPVED